jgi:uncharacterized protein (DUF433 family)
MPPTKFPHNTSTPAAGKLPQLPSKTMGIWLLRGVESESMAKNYVEQRESGYYIAGTRISLDSIVHAFNRGESAEAICHNFDLLRLEEVYGAIAYYLANQSTVDTYLISQNEKWAAGKRDSEPLSANLRKKLLRAREQTHAGRPS